jgi:hypothetical protein
LFAFGERNAFGTPGTARLGVCVSSDPYAPRIGAAGSGEVVLENREDHVRSWLGLEGGAIDSPMMWKVGDFGAFLGKKCNFLHHTPFPCRTWFVDGHGDTGIPSLW